MRSYNIFQKCLIGKPPFIGYNGQVVPCCWHGTYDTKLKYMDKRLRQTPFVRPDFNLYNNKLKDIIESDEWWKVINEIPTKTPVLCSKKCSSFLKKKNRAVTTSSTTVRLKGDDALNKGTKDIILSKDKDAFKLAQEEFQKNGYVDLTIETTSRCTLKCPYCTRTIEALDTPKPYSNGDLSLEVLEDICFTKPWKQLNDCGQYGDPVFLKHFHEFQDILIRSLVKKYWFTTAATGRNKKWWQKSIDNFLKMEKSGTEVEFHFGIDGLHGASEKHRIGQKSQEIWNTMLECKAAGLNVYWQVIFTSENEHQINEMKELSIKHSIPLKFMFSGRFQKHNDPLMPYNPDLFWRNNE